MTCCKFSLFLSYIISVHKRESLQYHQPLHRLYHHKHKKSHRSERNEEEKPVESHHMSTVCEEPVLDPSNEKVEPCENEPLLNLKDVKSVPSGVQKVQYHIFKKNSTCTFIFLFNEFLLCV